MSEKLSGVMREFVALVAGPRSWTDTRESWIARAARRAGISYRQAKSLWYGEITDRNHKSARLMRDAAEELAGRYEEIARRLGNVDADLRCADCDALIRRAGAIRDLVRAGNELAGRIDDDDKL